MGNFSFLAIFLKFDTARSFVFIFLVPFFLAIRFLWYLFQLFFFGRVYITLKYCILSYCLQLNLSAEAAAINAPSVPALGSGCRTRSQMVLRLQDCSEKCFPISLPYHFY